MLFKTLEIQGFKSFADKTVLEFDTRTTAVVGSNGNGKSNISDALRWVMGEQGAKTLRGEKMEDVIFHGTVERKPMGFARVALTIDNSDRALSVDSDEVVISRKLYRSGESEYLINGKKSRLRDIQELLMGTGLGRDGYSIIGQGRVSEIISARDTQRREIFEEAAGVSLFLHKKADAEKQLSQAEENIIRQRDLIRADEERLPILKRQSEKAVLASELLAEKKTLEISVSVARLSEKRGALSKLRDDLLLNQSECEHYERDIRTAEERIEKLGDDKLSAQGRLERVRSSIQSANDELAEKRAAISVAENDIKHNEQRRAELSEQLKNAEQSGRDFDIKINEINADIGKKQSAAEEYERGAAELRKELDEISEKSARAGEKYSALEGEIAAARSEEAKQQLAASMARRTAEEIEGQKSAFLSGLSDSEEKLGEYRAELANAKKLSAQTAEESDSVKNKAAGMERLAEGKKKRLEESRAALEKANSLLNEKNQRYRVLSDIEKSREGYYRSVKEVLRAGEQGRLTGVHGIVADVITVPEKYVTAMETVLQSVMQNIIVDNEETAARCISFLKETDAGRATFYPLTSIKGRSLNEPRLLSEAGFEGIASELVECDDEYAEIISNLLGTTAVVDDMSTAKVIGKKYGYKFRIVTLDGQLVNAGGSFTGGSKINKGGSIISRKQELDTLYSEITKLRESAKEKNEEFERYRAESAKFTIEMEGLMDRIRELEQDDIRTAAEISRLSGLIEQLEDQSESSKQSLQRFDSQIAAQNEIVSAAENSIKQLSEKISALEKSYEEQSGERSETENKIRGISERIKQFDSDRMDALHDIDLLKQQIKNVEDNRRMLLENSGGFKDAMKELDESDRAIRERIEVIRREIEAGSNSVSDRNEELSALTNEISECERKITELHKDISEANQNKEKFSRELARLDERQVSVQKEYDKIVSLLYDSYELTVSQAEEQAQIPDDLLTAENDLNDLSKRISALGMVNMESIEEYKTVSERYEFQSGQLRDIEDSKRELERLIAQLTEDIKKQFLDSFNDINKHFKDVFAQIFGPGSHAELELTNPEDVLSSGIEIKAAPPGKVIKNLISLSGGEQAMVAITIYFAILMHRPTPFCMLDEVDAPLDVINVEKYIKYVNQFSRRTQLMIISHRRGTIEGCSVLYGVFMQEKGVSRLLRQELSDDMDGVTN
ncbi:MAG: chromosome segregation protein SMC [Oscillospiraceae bacterium]|nr:chromosome segregation protein SMC [Oscillospiraceae bacterium]